ncbi:MAG TPA: membrane dipeptidase [Firmicutes bacterium]|nr:membrane dipeptidase [Bacillota bacterium]
MAASIIDFHCDTLSLLLRQGGTLFRRPQGQVDTKRMRQAGVALQVFAMFSHPNSVNGHLADALLMAELFWQAVDAGYIVPVLWREDLSALNQTPGGLLSIEGGEPLGTDVRMLEAFYRIGVRVVGLTWNGGNALADGVEVHAAGGLTPLGKEFVAEMNRLGMLVDVSHLAELGFWQVAELCRGPFIASHSNCRAVCPHARNLSDDQLRAIAASGGVVGINLYPRFLTQNVVATSADVIRHAEHMLSVMGRGHVGLGSDFDGIGITPSDLPDVGALPYLAEQLTRYFGAEIAWEIMGGAFMRLLQESLPLRHGSKRG